MSLNAHLVGESARVLREHDLAVRVVVFVADEQARDHLAILLDLVQPPANNAKEGVKREILTSSFPLEGVHICNKWTSCTLRAIPAFENEKGETKLPIPKRGVTPL